MGLDGTLEAALDAAAPAMRGLRFVLLTFGNAAFSELLRNFCAHARRAGAAHVVGAVDVGAFELLRESGSPCYKTPLALATGYSLDGANSHSSGSWKAFAAMRTGEVARVVATGLDVLHIDTDVVLLRDPAPSSHAPPVKGSKKVSRRAPPPAGALPDVHRRRARRVWRRLTLPVLCAARRRRRGLVGQYGA